MPGKVSGAKRIDHEGHQPQNKANARTGHSNQKNHGETDSAGVLNHI